MLNASKPLAPCEHSASGFKRCMARIQFGLGVVRRKESGTRYILKRHVMFSYSVLKRLAG